MKPLHTNINNIFYKIIPFSRSKLMRRVAGLYSVRNLFKGGLPYLLLHSAHRKITCHVAFGILRSMLMKERGCQSQRRF